MHGEPRHPKEAQEMAREEAHRARAEEQRAAEEAQAEAEAQQKAKAQEEEMQDEGDSPSSAPAQSCAQAMQEDCPADLPCDGVYCNPDLVTALCYGCGNVRHIKFWGSPRCYAYCRHCLADKGLNPAKRETEAFDPEKDGQDYREEHWRILHGEERQIT